MERSTTGEGAARALYMTAFAFAALALGPALAHLFELPNKIGLPRDDYFLVQQIYRGWALFGVVILGALISTLALVLVLRGERGPMIWAAAAFVCIAITQAIFWSFTYPANVATDSWTRIPDDWQTLRAQWEYSHAASAVFNLMAVLALAASALSWGAQRRSA